MMHACIPAPACWKKCTFLMAALAPQWLDAFDSAAHDLKRQMLQTLVTDWLASIKSAHPFIHQPSGLLLPHAALLELLEDAANSAARRVVIEEEMSECFVAALQQPPDVYAASIAINGFLTSTDASAAACLTARLAVALAAEHSDAIMGGLEHLSDVSDAARTMIMPVLLDSLKASLLSARPSFDHTARTLGDIARLKSLCSSSPYEAALAVAWPHAGG